MLRNGVGEVHEVIGLGNEVGLAVDFHNSANLAVLGDVLDNSALGSDTASLLGSLGQALLTQPVDGLVHVAVVLHEGLLAVHHAGLSALAQFLNQSSSNIRHGEFTLSIRYVYEGFLRKRSGN